MTLRIVEKQNSAAWWTNRVLDGTCTGLAVVGPGGLGKTHAIERVLEAAHAEVRHQTLNSHVTPLSLYKTLYENRDRVLLLDDLEHIYTHSVSVGILRAALEDRGQQDGKRRPRVVTYNTSRDLDCPSSFDYRGGVILIGNRVPRARDPIVQALLTRITVIDFEFAPEDVYAFMREAMIGPHGYALYDGASQQEVIIPRDACERVIHALSERQVTDLRKLKLALIAWLGFQDDPERLAREFDNVAQRSPQLPSVSPKKRAREVFLELVRDAKLSDKQRVELFREKTATLGRNGGYDRSTYYRWKKAWEKTEVF